MSPVVAWLLLLPFASAWELIPYNTTTTGPLGQTAGCPSSQLPIYISDVEFSPMYLLPNQYTTVITYAEYEQMTNEWTSFQVDSAAMTIDRGSGYWLTLDIPVGLSFALDYEFSITADWTANIHGWPNGTATVTMMLINNGYVAGCYFGSVEISGYWVHLSALLLLFLS